MDNFVETFSKKYTTKSVLFELLHNLVQCIYKKNAFAQENFCSILYCLHDSRRISSAILMRIESLWCSLRFINLFVQPLENFPKSDYFLFY